MLFFHYHNHHHLYRVASKVFFSSSANLFSQSTSREYRARKLIGFSDVQMYTVISDVKNYQAFIPFCRKSIILAENKEHLNCTLEIGFPPIVESYTSKVKLIKPTFVGAQCRDGILFNYLETTWRFSPGLESNNRTCIVDFHIKFHFRSVIYSQIAQVFFEKLVQQMEWAFISEAKRRYGKESVPSYNLTTPKDKPS